MPALVASTISSRATTSPISRPTSSSEAPSPYPAAVSSSVPPASAKEISWSRASCSSVSRPHVMVPRPSRETVRPVAPTARCFMRTNVVPLNRWVRPTSPTPKAGDELLRRDHPRHRGRTHRVPARLEHRPSHDRREDSGPPGRRPGGDRLHRCHPDGCHPLGDRLLRTRHRQHHPHLGAGSGQARVPRTPGLPDGLVRHHRHDPGRASSGWSCGTSSRTTCAACGSWRSP